MMANDQDLVQRIHACLAPLGVTEKKMFGGTCFMLRGNMVAGTFKGKLLVRVGKDGHAEALAQPHTEPMKMGGRTMRGFIAVAQDGTATAAGLRRWIDRAVGYARTLPPKRSGRAGGKRR